MLRQSSHDIIYMIAKLSDSSSEMHTLLSSASAQGKHLNRLKSILKGHYLHQTITVAELARAAFGRKRFNARLMPLLLRVSYEEVATHRLPFLKKKITPYVISHCFLFLCCLCLEFTS